MNSKTKERVMRIVFLFAISISLIISLTACNSQKSQVEKAESFMEKWGEAWVHEDGEALLSMFADDMNQFQS